MGTKRQKHGTALQPGTGSLRPGACDRVSRAVGRILPSVARRSGRCPRWVAGVALLGFFGGVGAQPSDWPDAPPPPEMVEDAPPPVLDERARQLQMLEEADITLIERPDGIIREYRIAGRLFMVEVVPNFGPRYYLIDTTGDGMLDTRQEGLGPDFVPPQWILFQW